MNEIVARQEYEVFEFDLNYSEEGTKQRTTFKRSPIIIAHDFKSEAFL